MAFRNNKAPVPCIFCGQLIKTGDEISWSRRNPEKGSWHPKCGNNPNAKPQAAALDYQTTSAWECTCTVCNSKISQGTLVIYNPATKETRHAVPCAPATYNTHDLATKANPFSVDNVSLPTSTPKTETWAEAKAKLDAAPQIPTQTIPQASPNPNDLGAVFAQLLNVPAQIQAAIAPAIESMRAAMPTEQAIHQMVAEALSVQAPQRVEHIFKVADMPEVKSDQTPHYRFNDVLKLATLRNNIMLYGEAGSGKTHAGRMIAQIMTLPFYYISLCAQTPESRLLGYMDAHGNYVKGVLYQAWSEGGVLVIDEADNASTQLLNVLNGALAGTVANFPCGMVERHADCIIVGTANTPGLGASSVYTDRRVMDAAFRDRWAWIEWNTDVQLESNLANQINPTHGREWAKYVQAARAWTKKNLPKLVITQRATLEGAKMLAEGFEASFVFETMIGRGFDRDGLNKLHSAISLPKF